MANDFPATIDQKAPSVQEHVSKHSSEESLLSSVRSQLTDVSSRLKMLEERYNTLRKTVQLTEQNAIETEKNNFKELQLVSETVLDVKKTVQEVNNKIQLLEGEISNFVPRTEFKTIERYVSFWEPMDFVTRKEVNDFLRKKFKELEEKKNAIKKT
ncbi:MAG: hypothetical protein ACOCQQ_03385 [Candidatus Nanoarchaeia archaeon]